MKPSPYYGVGTRVRILKYMPEHANKTGTIKAIEEVSIEGRPEFGSIPTPRILLDDGTTVYGFQVWWEVYEGKQCP